VVVSFQAWPLVCLLLAHVYSVRVSTRVPLTKDSDSDLLRCQRLAVPACSLRTVSIFKEETAFTLKTIDSINWRTPACFKGFALHSCSRFHAVVARHLTMETNGTMVIQSGKLGFGIATSKVAIRTTRDLSAGGM